LKEVCQSTKETSESLWENWHFENNFEEYQPFALYDNAWDAIEIEDYIKIYFVSQAMSFDGDFSAAWRLENARDM